MDQNRESEETIRSPGVLSSASDIVYGAGGALPVESTSQTVRTNVHGAKNDVPPQNTVGRRGGCELAPYSLRKRKVDGATRGGTAEPTLQNQNTR